jgi:hypothetical protein
MKQTSKNKAIQISTEFNARRFQIFFNCGAGAKSTVKRRINSASDSKKLIGLSDAVNQSNAGTVGVRYIPPTHKCNPEVGAAQESLRPAIVGSNNPASQDKAVSNYMLILEQQEINKRGVEKFRIRLEEAKKRGSTLKSSP